MSEEYRRVDITPVVITPDMDVPEPITLEKEITTQEDLDKFLAQTDLKHFELTAVVTRADGRVENHGLIAGSDKNPIKNAYMRLKIKIRRLLTVLEYGSGE